MNKKGPRADTVQAKELLRRAVQKLLPDGISIEDAKEKEVEKSIEGAVIGIETHGKKMMELVTQLLLAISKSRISN